MRKMQTRFVADISKYTENFFLGMSPRQTLFGITGGAVILLGSYLLPIPQIFPMLIGFAIIMVGFFQPEGLPLEKFISAWWDSHFVNPIVRHYESDNIVYDFLWRGEIGGRTCFRPADYLRDEGPPEMTAEAAQSAAPQSAADQHIKEKDVRKLDSAQAEPSGPPWKLTPEEAAGKTPKEIRRLENTRRKEYNRQLAAQKREENQRIKESKRSRRTGRKEEETPQNPRRISQEQKPAAESGGSELQPAPAPAAESEENNMDYRHVGSQNQKPADWTDMGGGSGNGYSMQNPDQPEEAAEHVQPDASVPAYPAEETAAPAADAADTSAGPVSTAEIHSDPAEASVAGAEPEDTTDEASDSTELNDELEFEAELTDEPEDGSGPVFDETSDAALEDASGPDFDEDAFEDAFDEASEASEDAPVGTDTGEEAEAGPTEDAQEPPEEDDQAANEAVASRFRAMQAELRRTAGTRKPRPRRRQAAHLAGGRSRQPGDYAVHRRSQ